jgi:Flp pilus assembly protein TadD
MLARALRSAAVVVAMVLPFLVGTVSSYDDDTFGARIAFDRGDADAAERILQGLLKRDPKFGRAHELLGDLRLQEGRFAEAEAEYRAAALCQPDAGAIAGALRIIDQREAATAGAPR